MPLFNELLIIRKCLPQDDFVNLLLFYYYLQKCEDKYFNNLIIRLKVNNAKEANKWSMNESWHIFTG